MPGRPQEPKGRTGIRASRCSARPFLCPARSLALDRLAVDDQAVEDDQAEGEDAEGPEGEAAADGEEGLDRAEGGGDDADRAAVGAAAEQRVAAGQLDQAD